jgi:hypothetical protein
MSTGVHVDARSRKATAAHNRHFGNVSAGRGEASAKNTAISPRGQVLKKILEVLRAYSTLFFHQEKSFHDHWRDGTPFCG